MKTMKTIAKFISLTMLTILSLIPCILAGLGLWVDIVVLAYRKGPAQVLQMLERLQAAVSTMTYED